MAKTGENKSTGGKKVAELKRFHCLDALDNRIRNRGKDKEQEVGVFAHVCHEIRNDLQAHDDVMKIIGEPTSKDWVTMCLGEAARRHPKFEMTSRGVDLVQVVGSAMLDLRALFPTQPALAARLQPLYTLDEVKVHDVRVAGSRRSGPSNPSAYQVNGNETQEQQLSAPNASPEDEEVDLLHPASLTQEAITLSDSEGAHQAISEKPPNMGPSSTIPQQERSRKRHNDVDDHHSEGPKKRQAKHDERHSKQSGKRPAENDSNGQPEVSKRRRLDIGTSKQSRATSESAQIAGKRPSDIESNVQPDSSKRRRLDVGVSNQSRAAPENAQIIAETTQGLAEGTKQPREEHAETGKSGTDDRANRSVSTWPKQPSGEEPQPDEARPSINKRQTMPDGTARNTAEDNFWLETRRLRNKAPHSYGIFKDDIEKAMDGMHDEWTRMVTYQLAPLLSMIEDKGKLILRFCVEMRCAALNLLQTVGTGDVEKVLQWGQIDPVTALASILSSHTTLVVFGDSASFSVEKIEPSLECLIKSDGQSEGMKKMLLNASREGRLKYMHTAGFQRKEIEPRAASLAKEVVSGIHSALLQSLVPDSDILLDDFEARAKKLFEELFLCRCSTKMSPGLYEFDLPKTFDEFDTEQMTTMRGLMAGGIDADKRGKRVRIALTPKVTFRKRREVSTAWDAKDEGLGPYEDAVVEVKAKVLLFDGHGVVLESMAEKARANQLRTQMVREFVHSGY